MNLFTEDLLRTINERGFLVEENKLVFCLCDEPVAFYSLEDKALTAEGKLFADQLHTDAFSGEEEPLFLQDCFRFTEVVCKTVHQFCTDKTTAALANNIQVGILTFFDAGHLPVL
jgi:hypothetical protein